MGLPRPCSGNVRGHSRWHSPAWSPGRWRSGAERAAQAERQRPGGGSPSVPGTGTPWLRAGSGATSAWGPHGEPVGVVSARRLSPARGSVCQGLAWAGHRDSWARGSPGPGSWLPPCRAAASAHLSAASRAPPTGTGSARREPELVAARQRPHAAGPRARRACRCPALDAGPTPGSGAEKGPGPHRAVATVWTRGPGLGTGEPIRPARPCGRLPNVSACQPSVPGFTHTPRPARRHHPPPQKAAGLRPGRRRPLFRTQFPRPGKGQAGSGGKFQTQAGVAHDFLLGSCPSRFR